MDKQLSLQEPFLTKLRDDKIPVSVFLVNGIKLHGVVENFDKHVLMLKNSITQMVFKHAISTVVPARTVSVQSSGENFGNMAD